VRVKKRLKVNSAVVLLSVAVIFAMLFSTAYRVQSTMERMQIADRLITAQFERLALRTDYLQTGSDRAREQVVAKYRQITDMLKSASRMFSDSEDRTTVDGLMRGHEAIGQIFRAIVANRTKWGQDSPTDTVAQEAEERLLSQLNIRIYEGVILGGRLQESANKALLSSIRIAGAGILFVLAFVGGAILINSAMMVRAIGSRIDRLRDGAVAVGSGNLGHRIDVAGDDEFTELSGVFNAMTERLRVSYQALEDEAGARRQVEQDLRLSENKFSTLFNKALFPAVLSRPPDYIFIDVNDAWSRLFGYSKKEAIGKTSLELGLNRNDVHGRSMIEEFALHQQVLNLEQRMFKKSGEPVTVISNAIAVTIAGQDYALISVLDITERKRTEEQIERNVAELRAVNDELTRFNRVAVGRELRMVELKKKVNSLCAELGRQPVYRMDDEREST
jgi:PAS domain S-box-containing protein